MNKETQYLLASVVESSQDSIVTIDLNRTITSWNKSAEYLYGYKSEEVIGKPLSLVMLPKDIQDLIDKVKDIIHEITVPIYETIRVHKNGKHSDLEIMLSPVRNANGSVIGVSTIARDITRRKAQEQQKDEFIAVASHELKTPVTSLKIYSEILVERFKNSDDLISASMVSKMDGQVNRLIGLIKTLLDTTQLVEGQYLLKKEQIDLNILIEEQIEAIKSTAKKHQIIFKAGTLSTVWADRKLIGQVITNLISNAIKYSPKGGEIIITSMQNESQVGMTIQDYGVGIPEEAKDKIFERYFRTSDANASTASGIGLGLYITANILRQHGGTISVESVEGLGSTFSFMLPCNITAE